MRYSLIHYLLKLTLSMFNWLALEIPKSKWHLLVNSSVYCTCTTRDDISPQTSSKVQDLTSLLPNVEAKKNTSKVMVSCPYYHSLGQWVFLLKWIQQTICSQRTICHNIFTRWLKSQRTGLSSDFASSFIVWGAIEGLQSYLFCLKLVVC